MKMSIRNVLISFILLLLFLGGNFYSFTENDLRISNIFDRGRGITDPPKPFSKKLIETQKGKIIEKYRLRYKNIGKIKPQSIIIHISKTSTLEEAILKMEAINFSVQIAVNTNGKAYQLMDSIVDKARATKDMDDYTIHILVIGLDEESAINNEKQKKKVVRIVKELCKMYKIPSTNQDIESKKGVFAHYQAKFKYGGFNELDDGLKREGAKYVRDIIWAVRGNKTGYFPESNWKNRTGDDWVVSYSKPSSTASKKKPTNGRGLTETPKAELKNVEQDKKGYIIEDKRIKYVYRGDIEITGVVLHFTFSTNLKSTLEWFDKVVSNSHIIVDKDGKAYQILDKLTHRAAAAYGTNQNCIQIEIIGMSENNLIENEEQKKKVIALVDEITTKYNIPRNNYNIDSGKGIFSHGQAKKRWGRSQWLYGTDFDPGEIYTKQIIESVGGTYYYDAIEYKEPNIPKILMKEFLNNDPYVSILMNIIEKNKPLSFSNTDWKDRFNRKWAFYPYRWTP